MNYIQTVKDAKGQTFTVIVAAPGSLLDLGDGWPLAAVFAVVGRLFADVFRRKPTWRITVSVIDDRGQSRGRLHREPARDEAAAELRAAEIVQGLRDGTWHPWR